MLPAPLRPSVASCAVRRVRTSKAAFSAPRYAQSPRLASPGYDRLRRSRVASASRRETAAAARRRRRRRRWDREGRRSGSRVLAQPFGDGACEGAFRAARSGYNEVGLTVERFALREQFAHALERRPRADDRTYRARAAQAG